MKKILLLSTISFTILLFTGCSDSNVPANYTASLSGYSLYIADDNFKFNSQGGVVNTTVNTHNSAWQFSGVPSWLTVTPKSGNTTAAITITASENLSADTARTSIFYLESNEEGWKYKLPIHVTQEAASSYITPSSKTVSFTGSKGSQTISVLSNIEWTVSSSTSWVNAEKSMDKTSVIIKVEANPTDVSRTAFVTLDGAGRVTSTIQITQEAAGVTGSTETLVFEKEGETKSISITADAAWEIKTSESWLSVTPPEGDAGSYTLNIIASENNSVSERTGYVYVYIGSSSKLQIPILQKGLYIEVNPASLTFSANTDSKQLNIKSNTDWCISSLPEWLSSSPQSGKNAQTITLTAQTNPSASNRNGKVKIEKQGLSLIAIVDVLQEGMSLSVDNNSLQFGADASTQSVVINTIAGWTASCAEGWITLSQTSGTGKSTLSISVEENREDSPRTGSVRIIAGELSQTITITQQGKYFNITESDKTFTSKGGILQISFSTNDSWTAVVSDNASWLILSSTNGIGDAVINITASDNASMKSRECVVTITPSNGQGAIIRVKQDGRYLTVDTESLSFGTSGGTSSPVSISTDGTYEISVTSSWMKVKEVSSSSFCIEASNNDGKTRSGKVLIIMKGLANGETYEASIYVEQEGNDINGHEYVDLGLPSGTMWATCNVGASSNTGIGNYYSWYTASSEVSKWGGGWRLPTRNEFQELIDKCKASGEIINGNKVLKMTGPNGHYIYMPLSGVNMGYGVEMVGDKGFYWSQTNNTSDSHYCLDARFNYAYVYSMVSDTWLMNVRPVVKK